MSKLIGQTFLRQHRWALKRPAIIPSLLKQAKIPFPPAQPLLASSPPSALAPAPLITDYPTTRLQDYLPP
jgi:hypothetical protein